MTEQSTEKPARGGLSTKLLPELRQIAGGMGIKTAGLKKADLLAAIRQAQSRQAQSGQAQSGQAQSGQAQSGQDQSDRAQPGAGSGAGASTGSGAGASTGAGAEQSRTRGEQEQSQQQGRRGRVAKQQDDSASGQQHGESAGERPSDTDSEQSEQSGPKQNRRNTRQSQRNQQQDQTQQDQNQQDKSSEHTDDSGDDEGEGGGSRRNRRRRGRERNQQAQQGNQQQGQQQPQHSGRNRHEPDLTVLEDDVLAPCAGILDLLDNYAFVRTSGYLPSPDDVYVSMSMVRKFGLRRGDAITGQVRQPREGERREKFNPLVHIDTVNGNEPENGKDRPEFDALIPVHPADRLRLETGSDNAIGRIVDLVAPIGKGQRGLVVSPAGAGRTMALQAIAGAVTASDPEVHLMVVLADARPEEVTDFQRSVRGEVIGSPLDHPPADHTTVAELAVERAKRLVELGHDVVLLIDGLTRLGRATHVAGASGRHHNADAGLHPAKKILGAARNVEDSGSLTIVATALSESGSTLDTQVTEEIQGAANWELRLLRDLADLGVFPAIDVVQSGTRRDEKLLGEQELQIVAKLRRELAAKQPQEAVEWLLSRLKGTRTNVEMLTALNRG